MSHERDRLGAESPLQKQPLLNITFLFKNVFLYRTHTLHSMDENWPSPAFWRYVLSDSGASELSSCACGPLSPHTKISPWAIYTIILSEGAYKKCINIWNKTWPLQGQIRNSKWHCPMNKVCMVVSIVIQGKTQAVSYLKACNLGECLLDSIHITRCMDRERDRAWSYTLE